MCDGVQDSTRGKDLFCLPSNAPSLRRSPRRPHTCSSAIHRDITDRKNNRHSTHCGRACCVDTGRRYCVGPSHVGDMNCVHFGVLGRRPGERSRVDLDAVDVGLGGGRTARSHRVEQLAVVHPAVEDDRGAGAQPGSGYKRRQKVAVAAVTELKPHWAGAVSLPQRPRERKVVCSEFGRPPCLPRWPW